jgi:putative toxin-antitoxin system antitoxin component (TIGR02293 family)
MESSMPEKRFVPSRRPEPVAGVHVLGLRITSEFEVVKRIRKGLAPTVVGRLAKKLHLSDKQVLTLSDIPESTFHARKRSGKALSPEHSGRVYRIAKAIEAAEAYFEDDEDAARRWLASPKVALGGETPLAFASTPEGSEYVLKLLERMEHGVVS